MSMVLQCIIILVRSSSVLINSMSNYFLQCKGSQLTIEWTNQHGCGPIDQQKNLHCQIILQYMCGSEVRDGFTESTPPTDPNAYNTIITDPTAPANTFGGKMGYE